MILPVMCMLLLGMLDLGYRAYVTSIVQGSLHEAARMATVGGVTIAQIETMSADRLQRIFARRRDRRPRRAVLFRFHRRQRAREPITTGYRPLNV